MKIAVMIVCALWAQWACAQMRLGKDTGLAFATVGEGKRLLATQDDFVRRMSPFDRAARLKTDQDVSEKEYLAFVGRNVRAWTSAEQQKVATSFQGVRPALEALSLPFPNKVFFVKTTGKEEGGAAYTRANAIVFPEDGLTAPLAKIQRMICHELFHIMSRENPALREKLYAAIGFAKCNEISFPLKLKPQKITNPDAPRNDHCIRVMVKGREHWAIPILFSSDEKYDVDRGGAFFNYLQFQLLLVERPNGGREIRPMVDGQMPKLVGIKEVSGFFEQVGRNTGYIIHPEEILADNFALLILGERNLPSPDVMKKIEAILKERVTAEPLGF